MKKIIALAFAVALAFASFAFADGGKPMTNKDVISLVKAKMPEETILMAVRSAKPKFDTSADGLIALSGAGVPQSVIQAMIETASGGGAAAAGAAPGAKGGGAKTKSGAYNPEEVQLIDAGQQSTMKYLVPQMRTGARALGFGGMSSYAVLNGVKATLRLKSKQPQFIVAVPTNAQPEAYAQVVNMAVRKNGTREVLVGGGYMGYSSGVAKDRIMPVGFEKLPDQSKSPEGFVMYKVSVTKELGAGEYAFLLYNSQVKVIGWFSSGLDSYFDFGIDG
jgi:hypothetical protein